MTADEVRLFPDAWGNIVPLDTHYCGGMFDRHCFLAGCPSADPALRRDDGPAAHETMDE